MDRNPQEEPTVMVSTEFSHHAAVAALLSLAACQARSGDDATAAVDPQTSAGPPPRMPSLQLTQLRPSWPRRVTITWDWWT